MRNVFSRAAFARRRSAATLSAFLYFEALVTGGAFAFDAAVRIIV
jgi:hypothetical protein